MNRLSEKTNLKIIPMSSPVCSLCQLSAKAPVLFAVTVTGIDSHISHRISFNIYGLSKSGFFVERTSIPEREYLPVYGSDELRVDFSSTKLNIKEEFFRSLKSRADGKLCVEAIIDGKVYMGDTRISLLPANVYPKNSTPHVFPAFLNPSHREVERIVSVLSAENKNLSGLYSALRAEKMIYSVRDCDFISHDVAFEEIGLVFSKRSKMASPLEMSFIFCSCAIRAGLSPVIAVVKKSKAPLIFCGIKTNGADFDIATCSSYSFRNLLNEKKVLLFDVSCLFTGHSVELSDATAAAEQALLSNDIYFALDVCAAVKNGTDFSLSDISCYDNNLKIAQSLRRVESAKPRGLSDYAEQLTKTDNNPLLDFDFSGSINLPVVFSDLLSVMAFAEKGNKIPVVSTSEKFDISRITRYGKGICTMLAPSSEFLFTELTHAEHQETAIAIEEYRSVVVDNEHTGIISTPLKQHAALDIVKHLVAYDGGENQLFLASGFLRYDGNVSPVALYPVKLFAENGEIHISFDIAKPYTNRLLCEKLKTTPYGKAFFSKYGMPGGGLDSIVSCFESFCEFSRGKSELINECAVCTFPYKNAQFSFSIVDRYEKIVSDGLVSDILVQTGKSVPADIKGFTAKAGEIEKNSVITVDSDVCVSAAIALDSDLVVRGADGILAYDLSVAVAAENMRCGHTTVIVSDSADVRRDIGNYFEKSGLSFAALELSANVDIKKSAAEKLRGLSTLEAEKETFSHSSEYDTLRCALDKRNAGKTRKYDFDFSFADAAAAYVRAGQALSKKEKELLIEPEGIFFPDMSRESSNAVFSAQINLCRAAGALGFSYPYTSHPFYYARLTDEQPNSVSCKYIADKGLGELSELKEVCVSICEKCGFDISDVKTFSALHAFLSLAVHISSAYDKNITDALLTSDIYSVSKKLASLRETCIKMHQCSEFLSDFDDAIFELDADNLISEWTNQQNLSRAEITRMILSHKKADVSVARKDIFEILSQLSLYDTLKRELECDESEMQCLFEEQYLGKDTDWSKLSRYCDFVKVSDVLLKKMYGTDKEKRDDVARKLKDIYEFCSDRVNSASVRSAAENFDRMFSEDGGFAALCDKLCVDIYSLCFENGLFSDSGIIKTVEGWRDNVSVLPAVSRYNRCVRECERLGLSGFVRYLEENSFDRNTESIFTRSLLFLALKQISLYDKGFISASSLEDDIRRFAELHEMRIGFNRKSVKLRHVTQVASYISGNQAVAAAFSESLLDRNFTPEELLLRHGETLKTVFPIIIAEPSMCSCLSDYDNVVFLGADTMPSAYAVPVLNIARHRLVVSGMCSENRDCFANDIMKTRISHIDLHRGESVPFSKLATYSYVRTPVSSYDRERGVNVLEAQTIGLEIIKKLEKNGDISVDILTFTKAQKSVMYDVLAAVSEKSHAVSKALSEGRITVGYCGQRSTLNSDMAFISTVYGKEENGLNLCCGNTDNTSFAYGGYWDKVSKALTGAARNVVVVSSFDSMIAPEKIGSFGHTSIYFLCGFACSGGNMLSAVKDGQGNDTYISEFCNLLSDNEIPVSVSGYGNCAIFEIKGKTYTAVFEKSESFTAYDRECSFVKDKNTLILDGAEIILNPHKILDTVTTIGEGC